VEGNYAQAGALGRSRGHAIQHSKRREDSRDGTGRVRQSGIEGNTCALRLADESYSVDATHEFGFRGDVGMDAVSAPGQVFFVNLLLQVWPPLVATMVRQVVVPCMESGLVRVA